jgi:hypothetical protein
MTKHTCGKHPDIIAEAIVVIEYDTAVSQIGLFACPLVTAIVRRIFARE